MNQGVASAVFDSQSEADRAVSELRSAGASDKSISIIAQHGGKNTSTDGAGEKTGDLVSKTALGAGVGAALGVAALAIPGVGPLVAAGAIAESAIGGAALTGTAIGAATGGLASLLTKHGVSDEDARYYEDRVNNGGVFVSVDTRNGGISPQTAQDILYRASGHSSSQPRTATTAGSTASSGGAFAFGSSDQTSAGTTQGQAVNEERIPIVEEELRVGKREVERGGVSVHTHVVEQPVHEQVRLREEHVEIERRPVTGATSTAGADAFQERTIEMDAIAEEAVVAKEAIVKEELVVRKDTTQRTETVDDTVRRTEVDVDKDSTTDLSGGRGF
jgi:uncharacterized protein (TIGR02271 family)